MSRVPELDVSKLNAEQLSVYQAIANGPRGGVRGPLAVWLNRPELADKAQQLGQYCRYGSSLSPRLSELAILTTAQIWNSAYEWKAHESPARKAGLSDEIIQSLANFEDPVFINADESIVYRFTQQLSITRKVSDETYHEAEDILGRGALIDLVGILGYYSLISMTINAFDIDS